MTTKTWFLTTLILVVAATGLDLIFVSNSNVKRSIESYA